jgi:hypothetical protein
MGNYLGWYHAEQNQDLTVDSWDLQTFYFPCWRCRSTGNGPPSPGFLFDWNSSYRQIFAAWQCQDPYTAAVAR